MSYAHSKENQSLYIIFSWLSLKFFDLTLHLLFFPLTGTVHCILPTIRLCSYNRSYLICFYMDQGWGCCISFGEWAEGSRAWPASPCKDQRICRCSSSKLQWLAMQSSGGLLLSPRSGSGSGRQRAGGGSLSSSIFDISVDSIHDELLICVLFEWNLLVMHRKYCIKNIYFNMMLLMI